MKKRTVITFILIPIILFSLIVIGTVAYITTQVFSLDYYDENDSIKSVSSVYARIAFITESGDVYIYGDYYRDIETGIGLSKSQKIGYKYRNFFNMKKPVKIYSDSAEYVELTDLGGLIIDENGDLYYFDVDTYRVPSKIADNCINATAFYSDILYVDSDNNLHYVNPSKGVSESIIGEGFISLKRDSTSSFCGLKTDNSLYELELKVSDDGAFESLNEIFIADNIISYDLSWSTISYLDSFGDVFNKNRNDGSVELLGHNGKELKVTSDGTAVLCENGELLYYGKDPKGKVVHNGSVLSEDVVEFDADRYCIIYIMSNGFVQFWGSDTYIDFVNDN